MQPQRLRKPRHQVVGLLLRCLRESLCISQAEFAERIGKKQSQISAWEVGWYRPRDVDAVVAKMREMGAGIGRDFLEGFPKEQKPLVRKYQPSDGNLGPRFGERRSAPQWNNPTSPDSGYGSYFGHTVRSTFGAG